MILTIAATCAWQSQSTAAAATGGAPCLTATAYYI